MMKNEREKGKHRTKRKLKKKNHLLRLYEKMVTFFRF